VSLVGLGAACIAAGARGDEVPLPGPVVDNPVVKLPAGETAQVSEPLWEFGLGVAGFRFDDYRGSDHTNYYLLPLPFFVYRGPFLRADRDGARAILFSGHRVVVDVSLGASVPTKSKDEGARSGMPNLAGTFEIGPNLVVELWQASDRKMKVELRMPVREAITLERSPRAIGLTFSPNLNLDISGLPGKGNLGLLAGPLFADRKYHQYFYGVAPEFATASRPAYEAPGGYAGWRATAAFSRRFGNAWLGAFVRYDDLHGATFAPSPLVRKESTLTAGFGISWIFATSSQRVRTDD
jgi:outer membrane scaffolding protein for murein synthesis (MipA/OmpV family)